MTCLLLAVVGTLAAAAPAEVPVDVGIGPAAYYGFGPLLSNRGPVPHFGLKLNVEAVIDQAWIAAHPSAVPESYRRQAKGVREVRITPSVFIPDSLLISPKVDSLGGVGVYGVSWRPIGVGLTLLGGGPSGGQRRSAAWLTVDLGLLVTAAYIDSDAAEVPSTFFLRPGLDLSLEAHLAASRSLLFSVGYAQQVYVPQKLGSFGFGPLDESVFLVGQAFLKVHVRFPYRTTL